jgi:hypothetical protein
LADQRPVIVVGAGRSGTNLLRDLICSFDGYDTWPCDEINYIWRHGNRGAPTDELTAADARPEVVRYVRRAFERQQRRAKGATVVEKTCATSLRVGFAHAIVPEARFVYIVRDGRDVAASAMQRWRAELDIGYLARKARFVPIGDLPYYLARYARTRFDLLRDPERRLSSWGPRFTGMEQALRTATLAEVCALQWRRCVEASDRQLSESVSPDAVHRLRYEDLVEAPETEAGKLASFLSADLGPNAPKVSTTSVGRWRTALDDNAKAAVAAAIGDTLVAHGYRR